jgi:hypothetical protein
MDTPRALTRSDYVGTLMVNLMELRRHDFKTYLRLSAEWLDMVDTASIEDIVALENRVIAALERL